MAIQVCSCGNRLLYEMDGGLTSDQNHGQKDIKFHVEKHSISVEYMEKGGRAKDLHGIL